MLDAYIIDKIKRRDEERKRESERPALRIPVELPEIPTRNHDDSKKHEEHRGVIIIDFA